MIAAAPGATFTATALGFPPEAELEELGARVVTVPSGTEVRARVTGAVEVTTSVFGIELLAPDVAGAYLVLWDGAGYEAGEDLVVGAADPADENFAFASPTDVAERLGREELDAEELKQTEALLEGATGLILGAVNRNEAWAGALQPVPVALKSICVEAVVRVLLNPSGVRSMQETLGVHSYGATFDPGGAGLALTASEERRARRAAGLSALDAVAYEALPHETPSAHDAFLGLP